MFQKINNFFSSKKNSKLINEISGKYLEKVNVLENEIRELSHEQLIKKIFDLKENYVQSSKKELEDKDLCIISAITREVSVRSIGLRHFDSQIIGGIALYYGLIAEMKTGEGKTLVATIPIILNFVLGKKVHLITVNDYLAKRDSLWMGPVYEYLNISNSFIQNDQSIEEKVKSYESHIVYGNYNELLDLRLSRR